MKNKKVMLICCIFGGWFGLHEFIRGNYKKAVLYLFTIGIFGLGWLFDIVMIACTPEKKNTVTNNMSAKEFYRIDFYDDQKEKSLYMKSKTRRYYDDYIIFDLETTGFDPKDDEIIEIGALKYKNNELIEEFNILIKPKARLPKDIVELTGITESMLKKCDTIDIVLPKFLDFIEDYVLIAHNSSFDLSFLEQNIKNLNLPMIKNKDIDTLYLARKNLTDLPSHKLEVLKKHFKLNYKSHRALEDCHATNYIYQYCKDKNTVCH